jgi:hypothetical protein
MLKVAAKYMYYMHMYRSSVNRYWCWIILVTKPEHNKIKETWVPIVKNIQGTVEIVNTPGYAGVSYNETADTLAGDAVVFGNLDMTASDVNAYITASMGVLSGKTLKARDV